VGCRKLESLGGEERGRKGIRCMRKEKAKVLVLEKMNLTIKLSWDDQAIPL
jgi:hypothetical protein